MAGRNEDDSFNILIGFILIVFLILAIIWALSGIFGAGCPEGTFECDMYDDYGNLVSRCGCCAEGPQGQIIEACGYEGCPEERPYHVEGHGCCPSPHPASCPSDNPKGCLVLVECGDGFCCAGDICEVYDDDTYECIPCHQGARCNPDNLNSCCEGYSCLGGFCKSTQNCESLRCTNYGQNCKICDDSGLICVDCEDNTVCFDTGKDFGECKYSCGDGYYVCPECPTGCCAPGGGCASCLGNVCNPAQVGNLCQLSPNIKCTEICVNVDDSFVCKQSGGCPGGYWQCNLAPDCVCCSVITGNCLSCLGATCEEDGKVCEYCDDTGNCVSCPGTICEDGKCVSSLINGKDKECISPYIWFDGKCIIDETDENGENGEECPPGFYKYGNNCISIDLVECPEPTCTPLQAANEDYCSQVEFVGGVEVVLRCSTRCYEVEGEYKCLTETPEYTPDYDDVPLWLQNLNVICPEVCMDVEGAACNPDRIVYDIYPPYNPPENEEQGDGYLNVKDLNYFDSLFPQESFPVKVTPEIEKYDFNSDGVIDIHDRNCLAGFCGGDCRIIGFEELGICVTAEYFDNSFTEEQKIAMGDYYKRLFRNVVTLSDVEVFDCDDIKSRNRPYCEYFSSEFKKLNLMRGLSHVMLDRRNKYFYSTCAYFTEEGSTDYKFGMHIGSTGCNNFVNIEPSDYFLYKSISYSMALFNNCVEKTSHRFVGDAGFTFEGNCDSYSENINTFCEDHYAKLQDCDVCDICDDFDFQGENCNTKYNIEGGCVTKYKSRHNVLYNELPNLANKCDSEGLNPIECAFIEHELRKCVDYFNCELCQEVYETAGGCDRCKDCSKISSNVLSTCRSRTSPSDAQSLLDKYGDEIHECVVNENIFGGNCMVYLECLNLIDDKERCTGISFWSYSSHFSYNDGNLDIHPKQLYCLMDAYEHDTIMGSKYIDFALRLMYVSGREDAREYYDDGVQGQFIGFRNNCPDGVLCEFFPEYCLGGIGTFPGGWFGGISIGNTIGLDKIKSDPGSYSPGAGLEGVEMGLGDGAFGMGGALGPGLLDNIAGPGGGWMQSQMGMDIGMDMGMQVGP